MALNSEFQEFCDRWLEKARVYDINDLNQCFDKFYTLYVVYNALYVEAAVYLHRKANKEGKEEYKLEGDKFPDPTAATKYALNIIGSRILLDSFENKPETKEAIEQLIEILEQNRFNVTLDPVWGEPKKNEDRRLLEKLKSPSSDEKTRAILQIIYQIRCNLVHGRKGLDPVQQDILIPLIIILEKVIILLYRRLKNAPYI